MTGIKDLDAVAANNTDAPPNGAPEGMAAAAVNNIQREQMANMKNDVVYRVPLLTDLKALDSTKQAEGSGITLTGLTVVGEDGGVFYYDSTSSATADDINIVEPTDTLGRWLRNDDLTGRSGTWVGDLQDISGNSATMVNTAGRWFKSDGLVTVFVDISTSDISSLTGTALRVLELPFTVAEDTGSVVVGFASGWAITNSQNAAGFATAGTKYISLYLWNSAAGTTTLTPANWTADGRALISAQYRTTE